MLTLAPLGSTFAAHAAAEQVAGLDANAAATYHRAVAKLRWAALHRTRVGLRDATGRILASADVFELAARLDGRDLRVRGVGHICETSHGAGRAAADLVARAVDEAESEGFDAVVVSSGVPYWSLADGFTDLTLDEVTLHVTESNRRGAPMVPVRTGERSDLAHLASFAPLGATRRFTFARSPDLMDFAITRHRLLAALSPPGVREVVFMVVEEGMRAAAYVVVTATRQGWTLEECGDQDPTGARIGALLQVLVARDAAERRATVTAWFPPGFAPPQVSVSRATPAVVRRWLKGFGSAAAILADPGARVAWWPGDPPGGP